jgi:hypothetical protein
MSESHSTCMKLVGEKTTKDKVQNHFDAAGHEHYNANLDPD